MLIKRSKYLFFFFRNFPTLDLQKLIDGKLDFNEEIIVVPILYGKEIKISKEEFDKIIEIKENDWCEYNNLDNEFLNKFVNIGIILSKENDESSKLFLDRENMLVEQKWHIYSALFNFMTKWKDIDVNFRIATAKLDSADDMKQMIEENGYPPLFYHQVENFNKTYELKFEDKKDDEFFKILQKRKTTRNFNPNKKMSFEDLSTILKYTFGVQGIRSLYESNIQSVKKTSPSGGGLHSTEVYILIMRVEGVEPGLYHYNVNNDHLYQIKKYSFEESINKANNFTVGQEYCTNASALFFLSNRYFRNYWKYRKNSTAYSVLLREGGHLCQNIYLIATKLNLGVFTAAINHVNIEDEIGLNSYEQGVSMMAGVGIRDENADINLEPIFDEFIPEKII